MAHLNKDGVEHLISKIYNAINEVPDTVPCIQIKTDGSIAAKVGTCTNYTLLAKSYAHANVINSNTARSALTLNVNGTGAKPIYINGYATVGSASNRTLPAGTYIIYYDGTNYHFRTDGMLPGKILNANIAQYANQIFTEGKMGSSTKPIYIDRNFYPKECGFTVERSVPSDAKFTDTVPCIQIETASTTAAKVGTCTNYSLVPKSYVQANVKNDNNAQSALTLSVNGISAKPIYINGEESSTNNYTLPAGTYIIYYDGTNYHFRTDGVLPGTILNSTNADSADALTVVSKGSATQPVYFDANGKPVACTYTLEKSVPSNAEFTDTKYTHPTTAGNKHIPSGGSTGQVLKYSADGTATWVTLSSIKFKNALGTEVTYNGSSAADLSGGVYNATNATKAYISTTDANDGLPILFTTWRSNVSDATTEGVAGNRSIYMDAARSFYFNASANTVHSSGGFFETSDERLKDIVNPIEVDLDKLSKLRKVYFNWKDKPDSNLQLGMIAQDVQELYPELVSETNGELSLSYDRLSVIALEAIDVLHNENNELKSRIEKLESLVNQLNEK